MNYHDFIVDLTKSLCWKFYHSGANSGDVRPPEESFGDKWYDLPMGRTTCESLSDQIADYIRALCWRFYLAGHEDPVRASRARFEELWRGFKVPGSGAPKIGD